VALASTDDCCVRSPSKMVVAVAAPVHRIRQENQVYAFVRLSDMFDERSLVAACGTWHKIAIPSDASGSASPTSNDSEPAHVERDAVSRVHERQWPSDRCFRRHVQEPFKCCSAHAAIGYPAMSTPAPVAWQGMRILQLRHDSRAARSFNTSTEPASTSRVGCRSGSKPMHSVPSRDQYAAWRRTSGGGRMIADGARLPAAHVRRSVT
jgi:hypothetical protein